MKIHKFNDGSEGYEYFMGDEVVLIKNHYIGESLTDRIGTHGVIERVYRDGKGVDSYLTAFLDIRTGPHSIIHVASWDVSPYHIV